MARRFAAAGRSLSLVGGSVRDALFPGPTGTATPHDLDLTTDALPAETERLVRGWADDIWTQGERFGTIGCRKGTQVYEITTYRAEVYAPDSRKPEVTFGEDLAVDLSRRDFTMNALALRLARHGVDRPLRRAGRPGGRPAAHAARSGDLVRRRPPAHAARRPLRGALLAGAGPGVDGRGGAHARPALHRLRRAHPRRARQDRHGRRAVGGAVVHCAHRPGRRVPARAAGPRARAGPDPPPQGRAGAHPGRGRQDVAGPAAAPGRAVPRRRQAAHARHHRRRRELPPPRGRRRAHDARRAWRPCATRPPTRTRWCGWSSCTCASTPTGWAGPTRPCAATCATPGRSSTG